MKLPIRIKETDQCLVLPLGVDFRGPGRKLEEWPYEIYKETREKWYARYWKHIDEPN